MCVFQYTAKSGGFLTGDFMKQYIVVVDDNKVCLELIKKHLETLDATVLATQSSIEGLSLIKEFKPAVIILDVVIPVVDGFKLASLINSLEGCKNIPIIFVSDYSDRAEFVNKGYSVGAVDCIIKPVDPFILQSKVEVFLQLDRQQQKQDVLVSELEQTQEELKWLNEKLEKHLIEARELSIRDALTGIHNRGYFDSSFEQIFANSKRMKSSISCIMFDLDLFKDVNDTCGHQFGDMVLQEFAKLLQKHLQRKSDLLARYGGEEFIAVLPNTSSEDVISLAEEFRLIAENHLYQKKDITRNITVSIGVATVCYESACTIVETTDDFIFAADHALYVAKKTGRNKVSSYDFKHVPHVWVFFTQKSQEFCSWFFLLNRNLKVKSNIY